VAAGSDHALIKHNSARAAVCIRKGMHFRKGRVESGEWLQDRRERLARVRPVRHQDVTYVTLVLIECITEHFVDVGIPVFVNLDRSLSQISMRFVGMEI